MSATYLKIEGYAGSDILDCAREALYIANQIGINVTFDFNDVHCTMGPGDDPQTLVDNYHYQAASTNTHKFAGSWKHDTP